MRRIALSQIESFGKSEERMSYCIHLKPAFVGGTSVEGEIIKISEIQADALETFLKALNDPEVLVRFPRWRTLTLGDIQISSTGDVNPMVSAMKDQHITVENYQEWARKIVTQSGDTWFGEVIPLRNGGFLSTSGEWSLLPRANDFVLAYLRAEISDIAPPANVAALSEKLRKIFQSELVESGALYFEGDGIHCDLGPITNAELLYLAESILPRQ